jgi:hypothetical protein
MESTTNFYDRINLSWHYEQTINYCTDLIYDTIISLIKHQYNINSNTASVDVIHSSIKNWMTAHVQYAKSKSKDFLLKYFDKNNYENFKDAIYQLNNIMIKMYSDIDPGEIRKIEPDEIFAKAFAETMRVLYRNIYLFNFTNIHKKDKYEQKIMDIVKKTSKESVKLSLAYIFVITSKQIFLNTMVSVNLGSNKSIMIPREQLLAMIKKDSFSSTLENTTNTNTNNQLYNQSSNSVDITKREQFVKPWTSKPNNYPNNQFDIFNNVTQPQLPFNNNNNNNNNNQQRMNNNVMQYKKIINSNNEGGGGGGNNYINNNNYRNNNLQPTYNPMNRFN